MSIANRLVTADEFLRWPRDGFHHELWHGEVFTMSPSGSRHGEIALEIGGILRDFLRRHRLGRVTGAESGFLLRRDPDTVLAPDVGFIGQDRIGPAGLPEGFFEGAPDLAIEVQSPSESDREATDKARRWLEYGTRQVWVIRPRTAVVDVYTTQTSNSFSREELLVGGDVLPGFSVKVAEIFSRD